MIFICLGMYVSGSECCILVLSNGWFCRYMLFFFSNLFFLYVGWFCRRLRCCLSMFYIYLCYNLIFCMNYVFSLF